MKRPGTRGAAAIGGAGFVVATLAQLALFRHASGVIGLEQIGLVVWLQSVLFLARLPEIGAGPNLTRRLAAQNMTCGDPKFAQDLWSTLLSITGPTVLLSATGLAMLVIWPKIVGETQDPAEVTAIAVALCVSAVLGSVVAILTAAHDGIGDLAARGLSLILFGGCVLGCGVPLVGSFGALGYALAVPAGLALQCAALCLSLVRLGATLRPATLHDIGAGARRQVRENLTLNGISVCRLLFEPLTKTLLFASGSLETVAVFDVLNKVVTAVRVLVSTLLQPLLFRKSQEHAAGAVLSHPGDQRLLDSVALYVAAGAVCAAPVLEVLVFAGSAAPDVTFVLVVLAVSSAINLSGQIAYLNLLAMADYGALLRIHLAMVGTNVAVAAPMGAMFGARGVVLGYAATMALGGIALRLMAPRSPRTSPRRLIPNAGGPLELLLVLGVLTVGLVLLSGRAFTPGRSVALTGCLACMFLFTVARPLLQKGGRA